MAQRDKAMNVVTPELRNENSLKGPIRAFEIIEHMSTNSPVGVSELADQLELPKSTTQDYLNTLYNSGYVVKNNGKYSLSLKMLNIAGSYRGNMKLFRAARSEIDRLAEKTGETVNLGVEQNGYRVKLYDSEGKNALQTDCNIGDFTYMSWSPMGKAMLAALPDDRVNAIIDQHGLPKSTENTITDRDELFDEIEQARSLGYVIDDEEHKKGLWGIGIAITEEETVIGAASICGPKSRLSEENTKTQYVDELREMTDVIGIKYQNQ